LPRKISACAAKVIFSVRARADGQDFRLPGLSCMGNISAPRAMMQRSSFRATLRCRMRGARRCATCSIFSAKTRRSDWSGPA